MMKVETKKRPQTQKATRADARVAFGRNKGDAARFLPRCDCGVKVCFHIRTNILLTPLEHRKFEHVRV